MLDHSGVAVPPEFFDKTLEFYLKALEPLGYKSAVELHNYGVYGLGPSIQEADFWLAKSPKGKKNVDGEGTHWAFKAKTHAEVEAFHKAALAAGATCNGPPGFRAQYHPDYYAAFAYDPLGNNIEVVCHCAGEAARKRAE